MRDYSRFDEPRPSKVGIIILIALIILVGGFIVSTASSRFSQPEKGTLVIGTNTPYKPFEYKNGESIIGFDMEIAQKIADKTGRKVIVKDFSDFAAIFPALETGTIDMAISAISIDIDRDEVMDFSIPYYNTNQSLITLKKNNINTNMNLQPNDFKGLMIGYQEKTTSETWVQDNLNNTVIKGNISYSNVDDAVQFLRQGEVDGILLDEPVALSLSKDYPDLVVSGIINTNEQYGVAVKQGDPQKLLPDVNSVIEEMKKNGEYNQLIKKYFGG